MPALLIRTSTYPISCSIFETAAEMEVVEATSHSMGITEPPRLLAVSVRVERRRPRI
jgi:hypothetical protein